MAEPTEDLDPAADAAMFAAAARARSGATPRKQSLAHGDILKYRKAFDSCDYKKIGSVKGSDLNKVISKLGYKISKTKVDAILENNGLNSSSDILFAQFIELIPRNENQITKEEHKLAELRDKFSRYDTDKNGMISLQEAGWALQTELKVSSGTALRLLNQFIQLNYEQFVEFYQQVQEKKLEIYEKFGKYDKDKDGLISLADAHSVLQEELSFSEERSRAMVRAFDTNHDGRVSYMDFAEFYISVEEKKKKVRATFKHFDVEGKGYVTYEQADEILQEILGFSEARSRATIQQYDRASNGQIDYEDFIALYSMIEEEKDRLVQLFTQCDDDRDGRISYSQFSAMLSEQGYTDEEVKNLFPVMDTNEDGFLDFSEFRRYLNFHDPKEELEEVD